MSDRYWVGGSDTWNATAGAKWSTTSGGAGGSAVPTSSDDVYIDNYSGASTVVFSGVCTCRNLDFNNGTGGAFVGTATITSSTLYIYGSLILSAGMSFTGVSSNMLMRATTGNHSITSNGKSWPGGAMFIYEDASNAVYTFTDNWSVTGNGVGITQSGTASVIFAGDLTLTGSAAIYTVTKGNVDFGDGTITIGGLSIIGAASRVVDFGNSQMTISGTTSGFACYGTNFTLTCGASQKIIFTGTSPVFNVYEKTFNEVEFKGADAGIVELSGGNTFTNLRFTPTSGSKLLKLSTAYVQTILGEMTKSGSSYSPFALPAGILISSPAVDTHAPATFTTDITISCTVGAACDNVYAQINDKVIALVNVGGNNWSVTIYAGYFGACTNQTVYFTCRTDAENSGLATDPSTITIPAITTKTATLLTQIAADLTAHSVSGTVTLIGEEEVGGTILSLIKIVVATYSVATIDTIRTVVAAHVAGWSGSVSSVEYSAPVNASSSIVIYKMIHS